MTKPDPIKLTRRERAIMDILHRRGRATAHEVLADLDDPPSYSAVASRADAKRTALGHVLKTFFGGSVEQAVAALVEPSRSKLSREELDRISDLIERAKKEGR
jgi:predicted transcriptional regulator